MYRAHDMADPRTSLYGLRRRSNSAYPLFRLTVERVEYTEIPLYYHFAREREDFEFPPNLFSFYSGPSLAEGIVVSLINCLRVVSD
jgi:ABC-type amino acid transport system permease subunit